MTAVGESLSVPVAARVSSREDALSACYQEHGPALVGYLVTLLGDLALAQDFAQEAFVELYARWRGVRHPRAYVYMVATNLARAHWRRSEREGRALASVQRLEQSEVGEHDPWLRDLVNRLPEPHRVPVLLHYYADLPIAEVARQLQLPQGTVKRRLHEARALLLSCLGADDA